LILFRNISAKPKRLTLKNGRVDNLISELKKVEYDGGTQMAAITPFPIGQQPDMYFLFSDGISNFGSEWPQGFKSPVYAFSSDPNTNHLFLRRLAHATGGEYYNLAKLKDSQVVASIGQAAYSFISATVKGGKLTEIVPAEGQPVHGRFNLAGKLNGPAATLILNYGAKGRILHSESFEIKASLAEQGDLLARFWAQKKVMQLAMFPKRNQQKLVELGKRYGLVTPGTSLIVLERLEQYVEHEIAPPKTLPEMRNEYMRTMDARMANKKQEDKSKLEAIIALWQKRIDWWKKDFKYPKNFRYKDKPKKKGLRASTGAADPMDMEGEAERDERPSPDSAAPPPPNRPRPVEAKEKKKDSKAGSGPEPAIALKPWDPKTPYMAAIKKASAGKHYAVYLSQKESYGQSPAFFLDSAEFFLRQKNKSLGLRVLSNVAEMELENAALLRILAQRLAQLDMLDLAAGLFEEILRLRPEEPQSYRDLALVLARQKKYKRAMQLLAHVVMNRWDRFSEIEVIALMELNSIIPRARKAGIKDIPLDKRLVKELPIDVRIVLAWDADLTDIDLWVIEPSGEKAYYSHPNTTIGGLVSRDFTQGYGPETYNLKKAMRGTYKVQVNFFGSRAQTLSGAVTLQLDLFTNYGRPNQKRKSVTLRLTEKKETITVGVLEF
jgi:Ca-activated chloride channel homolog